MLSQENELAPRVVATLSKFSEWRHVEDQVDGIKLGLAKSDGNRYHLQAGFEATNQTYQPDYGLPALNGRPVRNVFDKHYYVSSHLHVSRRITPGEGRSALLSATYRF